jgi:hypothetical protein
MLLPTISVKSFVGAGRVPSPLYRLVARRDVTLETRINQERKTSVLGNCVELQDDSRKPVLSAISIVIEKPVCLGPYTPASSIEGVHSCRVFHYGLGLPDLRICISAELASKLRELFLSFRLNPVKPSLCMAIKNVIFLMTHDTHATVRQPRPYSFVHPTKLPLGRIPPPHSLQRSSFHSGIHSLRSPRNTFLDTSQAKRHLPQRTRRRGLNIDTIGMRQEEIGQ